MRRRHLFFYKADGAGSSADSAEAALDHTFGPLGNVRPDLAANEEGEIARRAQGGAPKRSFEIDRPALDSELPPKDDKTEDAKKAEAARTTPPAEAAKEDGSDPESPDNEDDVLASIVDKYQGNTRSMAKANREIRSLQTKTAEEKKALEQQLEAVAAVIDRDYDWVDGKPVLKPEVAARSLRNESGRPKGQFAVPSEDEIRASVETEFKKQAVDLFDEDQIPSYMSKMKPMIDSLTKERMNAAKVQAETYRYNMLAEVGNVVERHLRVHPDDKAIMPEVDAFYANVPEEMRAAAVLEEWIPFGKIAELVRIKKSLPSIAKEAYELGKKHRGESGKVTEPGSPGRSRPTPPNARGSSGDVTSDFKESVKRGSGLPSIDTIFA